MRRYAVRQLGPEAEKELTEFMIFEESTPADSAVLADRFLSSVRDVEIVEDMPASSVD